MRTASTSPARRARDVSYGLDALVKMMFQVDISGKKVTTRLDPEKGLRVINADGVDITGTPSSGRELWPGRAGENDVPGRHQWQEGHDPARPREGPAGDQCGRRRHHRHAGGRGRVAAALLRAGWHSREPVAARGAAVCYRRCLLGAKGLRVARGPPPATPP